MTAVLQVETYSQSTVIDLLGSGGVYAVVDYGTEDMDPDSDVVTTVYRIYSEGADYDAARKQIEELLSLLDDSRKWHDDQYMDESVWLRRVANDEQPKRALIKNYAWRAERSALTDELQSHNQFLVGRLAITRLALWEAVTDDSLPGSATVNLLGGKVDVSSLVTGTLYQNERVANISAVVNVSSGYLDKLWMGMRPARYGVSQFQPVWDFEDFTTIGSGVDLVTVSGSHGGQVLRHRFSDGGGSESISYQIVINAADAIAGLTNAEHIVGDYLVLYRFQVSAANTVIGIRMSSGWAVSPQPYAADKKEEQYITSSGAWYLQPMGVASLPPHGYRKSVSDSPGGLKLDQLGFWFEAERISGSGYLYSDCIALIPHDHFVALENVIAANTARLYVAQNEDMSVDASVFTSLVFPVITNHPDITAQNDWAVPKDTGVLVIAGQTSTGSVKTDQLTSCSIARRKRWRAHVHQ